MYLQIVRQYIPNHSYKKIYSFQNILEHNYLKKICFIQDDGRCIFQTSSI